MRGSGGWSFWLQEPYRLRCHSIGCPSVAQREGSVTSVRRKSIDSLPRSNELVHSINVEECADTCYRFRTPLT